MHTIVTESRLAGAWEWQGRGRRRKSLHRCVRNHRIISIILTVVMVSQVNIYGKTHCLLKITKKAVLLKKKDKKTKLHTQVPHEHRLNKNQISSSFTQKFEFNCYMIWPRFKILSSLHNFDTQNNIRGTVLFMTLNCNLYHEKPLLKWMPIVARKPCWKNTSGHYKSIITSRKQPEISNIAG